MSPPTLQRAEQPPLPPAGAGRAVGGLAAALLCAALRLAAALPLAAGLPLAAALPLAACGDAVPPASDGGAGADGADALDPDHQTAADTASAEAASADSADDAGPEPADDADTGADADVAALCPGGAGCPCSEDGECDDGDPCTTGQLCPGGACTAGVASCDDGNACTADACSPDGACTAPASGGPCSDGDPCTLSDTCSAGVCAAGKALACDDANGCTSDACQAGIGCVYMATSATCADENACTQTSFCHLGHCQDGAPKVCDDGSPCTWETCMPETGCTAWALPLASACTDTVAGGRCWQAMSAKLTWAQARGACHAWGGELASVRSKPDNDLARGLVEKACGKVDAWLGYSDHAQEGHWRWLDGGPLGGFAAWAKSEPTDAGDEDFAVLGSGGEWNDVGAAATAPCLVCARPLAVACDDPLGCSGGAQCAGGACLGSTATATCDDGDACTADACAVGSGCSHKPLGDGASCGAGLCAGGVCVLPPTPGKEPPTCAAILLASAATPTSGLYWIDPDGPGGATAAFQAWCDMHSDGGGWTTAMIVDGADAKFNYDGEPWLKPVAFGPSKSSAGAVLPSAWLLPVTALRISMLDAGVRRGLTLAAKATSLQQLFVDGKQLTTAAGLPAWEGLLAAGSLQPHCQLEGINVSGGSTAIRVGILGNNENDCGSVDSWIGVGGKATICGIVDQPVAGNVACWGPDNGDRALATITTLLVR